VLLLSLGWVAPGFADMVFPARLELVETEAGLFEVRFNLPVQNQARLKATPVLPPVCVDRTPRSESATPGEYALAWQASCPAGQLPGQTVGVDGLLGSPTDVLLSIRALDGRQYSTVLKPARSQYVIPQPPGVLRLAGSALLDGLRDALMRVELVLLAGLVVWLGVPRRAVLLALITGGAAYAAAQALVRENLLLLPASLPGLLVLLLVLYVASRLATAAGHSPGQRFPAWLLAGFVGALCGGALPGMALAQEWSRLEQGAASIMYSLGMGTGVLVSWLLWVEFRQLLRSIPALYDAATEHRSPATLTAIAALGLLLYQLSAVSLLPELRPSAPAALFVMALLLGIHTRREPTVGAPGAGPWLVAGLLLVAGLVAGAYGMHLPLTAVGVPLLLFVLSVSLVVQRGLPRRAAVAILALAAFYAAAQAGLFLQENLSRPVAHMVGTGVLAALLFLLGRGISAGWGVPVAGALGAGVALLLWGQSTLAWWQSTVATDYALGLLRVPLLSLLLLVLALLFRPRRSRVAAHLGVAVRKPVTHLALLVLALALVPVGNLPVRNPLFEQNAPRAEQAQRIFAQVLAHTYSAFNLEDEEQLYRQLSESVGDELVEDLYLDSRRRLTSGVREGAEVTVKDVSVQKVGALLEDSAVGDAFAYDVEWVVTARVRHLQHVHHRRNIYTGVLKIRAEGGKWKLEQVDLKSEDRSIVAGGPA
jgi:hypothetical protein